MPIISNQMLPIPVHSGAKFLWNKNVGTIEASLLRRCGETAHARIWADAADVGFKVKSPKTGDEVLFVLSREERRDSHPNSDLVLSEYVSSRGVKIVIFNT